MIAVGTLKKCMADPSEDCNTSEKTFHQRALDRFQQEQEDDLSDKESFSLVSPGTSLRKKKKNFSLGDTRTQKDGFPPVTGQINVSILYSCGDNFVSYPFSFRNESTSTCCLRSHLLLRKFKSKP